MTRNPFALDARAVSLACLICLMGGASEVIAQLTYPGCPDLKPTDFQQSLLVSNAADNTVKEPLKMAFDMDAQGNVDIYFTQRFGLLRKYSAATRRLSTVADFAFTPAQVPVTRNSWGLIGIALDPGFRTNHWMYLFIGYARDWRIARFLVNGDKLDPASEKVIFRFDPGTTPNGDTHVAGPLQFDAEGNLWATVSDNENPGQSANTNSYLGKIIRIRPRPLPDAGAAPAPGPGSTYDIPAGNLYPQGTAKTLPEVYVMGARNPYSLAIDPVRKGIAWGDIGPDISQVGTGTEEFNFTRTPGNFGYPFWAGNQYQMEAGHGTPEAPINERSDNTGLRELKPATAATIPYRRACAVTGPFYKYNPASKAPGRLPPHLDGKWLVGDFNLSWIDAVTLDNAGKYVSRAPIVATSGGDDLDNPLDIQIGPDGVLYVINYSGFRTTGAKTGLLKVEYKGSCVPLSVAGDTGPAGPAFKARLSGGSLELDIEGPHSIKVLDVSGRLEFAGKGHGPTRYALAGSLKPGLHVVEASTDRGAARSILPVTHPH